MWVAEIIAYQHIKIRHKAGKKISIFISLLSAWNLLLIHCRCRVSLMPLITLHDSPPTHTHTHHIGITPLDRGSVRRRDLYLTKHNTRNKQTSMHAAAFESAIPASERTQTHAADCTATRIGRLSIYDPEKAPEVKRKGKLILYSRSDLSKSYLYWQCMNIDILCTHVKPGRE